jgi:hypothetical protein
MAVAVGGWLPGCEMQFWPLAANPPNAVSRFDSTNGGNNTSLNPDTKVSGLFSTGKTVLGALCDTGKLWFLELIIKVSGPLLLHDASWRRI